MVQIQPCEECANPEPDFTCELSSFEKVIANPEPTGIIFIGRETENEQVILQQVIESNLEMDVGILDMLDEKCDALSEKYGIDRNKSQLVVFRDKVKVVTVSLEEGDIPAQIEKVKTAVAAPVAVSPSAETGSTAPTDDHNLNSVERSPSAPT